MLFRSDKSSYACLWIESRKVAGFKYMVGDRSFAGVIQYMKTGMFCEFDDNPMQVEPQEDGFDFQTWTLKYFVEEGASIQYVPLFREYNDKISGNIPMFKGTIYFRIQRTKDNLDYLREYKQIV